MGLRTGLTRPLRPACPASGLPPVKGFALDRQASADADTTGLKNRYGGEVQARLFDGDGKRLTEMDALVAYLQMLCTKVDFTAYEPRSERNEM